MVLPLPLEARARPYRFGAQKVGMERWAGGSGKFGDWRRPLPAVRLREQP